MALFLAAASSCDPSLIRGTTYEVGRAFRGMQRAAGVGETLESSQGTEGGQRAVQLGADDHREAIAHAARRAAFSDHVRDLLAVPVDAKKRSAAHTVNVFDTRFGTALHMPRHPSPASVLARRRTGASEDPAPSARKVTTGLGPRVASRHQCGHVLVSSREGPHVIDCVQALARRSLEQREWAAFVEQSDETLMLDALSSADGQSALGGSSKQPSRRPR